MSSSLGWGLDGQLLLPLRLQKLRQAVEAGEAERALIEAEEILEDDPDHLEALMLLGRADQALGFLHSAWLSFDLVRSQQPDLHPAWMHCIYNAFHTGYLPQAEELAQEALMRWTKDADIWFYLGLIRERRGLSAEGQAALRQATALNPQTYPPLERLTPSRWQSAWAEVVEQLPSTTQAWLSQPPLILEEVPAVPDALTPSLPSPMRPMEILWSESSSPEALQPSRVLIYTRNGDLIVQMEALSPAEVLDMSLENCLEFLGDQAVGMP